MCATLQHITPLRPGDGNRTNRVGAMFWAPGPSPGRPGDIPHPGPPPRVKSAAGGASPAHAGEEVAGDLLGARVGAFGLGVDLGADVAGGFGERVGPPAGAGVEDEVVLWAGVDRAGVLALGLAFAVGGGGGGEDLEAGDFFVGVAVPFPADEAGDCVAEFHVGVFEEPVV